MIRYLRDLATTTLSVDNNLTLISSDLQVAGNLVVTGNVTSVSSNNLTIHDSIIELHSTKDSSSLLVDDGKDLGIRFNYYKTSNKNAFLGWSNSTGQLEYYSEAIEGTNGKITGTLGTAKFGSLIITNQANATSTSTGAITVAGGVGVIGNVYAENYFYANGTSVSSTVVFTGGNISNPVNLLSTVDSTSATTGALVVAGGVGTSGNVTTTGNIVVDSLVSPGDANFSNVELLLHLDGTFTDSSARSIAGITGFQTGFDTIKKFGMYAIRCNPVAYSRIIVPANANLNFGTGNFTIEFWVQMEQGINAPMIYLGAGNHFLSIVPENSAYGSWRISVRAGSNFPISVGPADYGYSAPSFSGEFKHLALVRQSNTFTIYVNGVVLATGNGTSASDFNLSTGFSFGLPPDQLPTTDINAKLYIDELRITKGVARYTTNFTPSASAYLDRGDLITGGHLKSNTAEVIGNLTVASNLYVSNSASVSAIYTDSYFYANGTPFSGNISNAVTLTGTETLTNKTLTSPAVNSPKVKGEQAVTVDLGTLTTGTTTVNLSTAQIFAATIAASATVTFAFSNTPSAGQSQMIMLQVTNGGSGTVNWPSGTKFSGGSAPALTANGVDLLGIFYNSLMSGYVVFLLGRDIK